MAKKKLKYSVNRALHTEFLPYETPFHFTNQHFYNYINSNKISICLMSGEIASNNLSTITQEVLELLFNHTQENKNKRDICRAFKFKISHPKNVFRELAIMHPRSQLLGLAFYKKYKELILYNTTKNSFSLRYPFRLAQYVFFKNKEHYNSLIQDCSIVEIEGDKSTYVKSFFSYQKYSNVSMFYDSKEFNEYEKKYNILMKQDVSKCFDSIYTHSLAWAIYGIEFTKQHLAEGINKNTFHSDFDKLMAKMNFNETNGILIGSELSRIFAEIIFQSIDRKVKKLLQEQCSLYEDIDYKIVRYVDDYFIYCNNEKEQQNIIDILQNILSEFKLSLNISKSEVYKKPVITNISVAKLQLSIFLTEQLKFNLEKLESEQSNIIKKEDEIKGDIHINLDRLILTFKSIVKNTEIEYSQILNYTFSILQNKIEEIFKGYKRVTPINRKPENLIKSLLNLVDFCFFIYTVSPQVTTTIRLSRILSEILFFLKANKFSSDCKDQVYRSIFNNIEIVFENNKINVFSQIETINLLLISDDLEGKYQFTESQLIKYFNLDVSSKKLDDELQKLNYFSYTALLFYIKNKKSYRNLKRKICMSVIKKIKKMQKTTLDLRDNTEYTILLFDLIACPYLERTYKIELLKLYKLSANADYEIIVDYISQKKWFISWGKINFREELDRKIGLEVY